MAVGDYAFDAHVGSTDENLDKFLGQVMRQVIENVLNVGFAHRLKKMKKGIQLSKMIVTKQSFRKRMP